MTIAVRQRRAEIGLLRALGARVGERIEISTIVSASPDLIVMGEESFFADAAVVGPRRIFSRHVEMRETHIGRRTFIGNGAVVPGGADIDDLLHEVQMAWRLGDRHHDLAVDLLPEITYPSLTVRTEFDGAAPAEVESLIHDPDAVATWLKADIEKYAKD